MKLLEIKNLKTYFYTTEGISKAIDGIDFEIYPKETLSVVGESGCGKSVTALSIMRLIPEPPGRIIEGEIIFKGEDLLKKSKRQMRDIRGKEISIIFQEPMTSLNPVYTIGNQIIENILIHKRTSRKEAMEHSIEILKKLGIRVPDQILKKYPHQLSGGMRQRVMIAIAISCNPALLIADEPTTALDVTIQAQLLDLLNNIKELFDMSIMMITHDLGVVAKVSDRVAVIYAGKVVEYADVKRLFANPSHPYTWGLINSMPRIDKEIQRLDAIPGIVPNSLHFPKGCRFNTRCQLADEKCLIEEPEIKEVDKGHKVRCWHYQKLKEVRAKIDSVPYMYRDKKYDIDRKVLLEVKNLRKYFSVNYSVFQKTFDYVKAVDGISFYVKEGETLGLVGESGCGKSTTAAIILRLEKATDGFVTFEGDNVYALNKMELRNIRKKMQIIFQDPYGSLNPRMTIANIISEPLVIHNLVKNKKERDERVRKLLDSVSLSPEQMKRYPHEFSAGQRQRIAIARALAVEPKLIIADEPVSALDVSIQAQIINLLQDLQKEFNLSYLFIAHDLSVVKQISDRVAVMYLGKIVEMADKKEIFLNPLHPYTQALISAIPIPDPKQKKTQKILIGDVPSPVNQPEGCRFYERCPQAIDICSKKEPALKTYEKEHYVACHLF